MRKTPFLTAASLLISLFLNAQINIPVAGTVSESFNALGASSAASLPSGWKMSTASTLADWSTVSNVTTVSQAASTGTPTAGGRYNWGTSATDRAIGFMTDGSYGGPNTILAQFRNGTGATITEMTISFQVERYRSNTAPFYMQFYGSHNGSLWTELAAGSLSAAVFPKGASAYNFETPKTVYKSITLSGLSIAANSDYYFRWTFGSAAGGQGLGLDNVVVSVNSAAPSITATLQDALTTDVNGNAKANEGDKLTYTATITNKGKEATSVQYNAPLDANTTLNGAVKSSAIAVEDNFTTALNTVVNGNVLTNDFGLPSKIIHAYGNTENPLLHVTGDVAKTDNGGSFSISSDGAFTYTPPAGFVGYDRFAYEIQAGVTPHDMGVVTIKVGNEATAGTPEAFPGVIGNVQVSNAPSLLSNDGGSSIRIGAVNGNPALVGVATTAISGGGNLTIHEDGTFTYNPAPGYTGAAQFNYTIDNGLSAPQTVTVNLTVAGTIWFIDNTAAAGGDGRLTSPFNSLASISNGAGGSTDNQTIFVYSGSGPYTGGIVLKNGQKLIGQAAGTTLASIAGITVPAYSAALPATSGTAPVLTSVTNVITLASGNTVRGVSTSGGTNSVLGTTISGATIQQNTFNGASGEAISLTAHSGTSLISGNTVSATSYGIRVITAAAGTLNLSLTNNSITSTAANGAQITGTGGTLTITGFAGNTVSGNTALTGISVTGARFDAVPWWRIRCCDGWVHRNWRVR